MEMTVSTVTDRSRQTVLTRIRLKKLLDQGLHCWPSCLQHLEMVLGCKSTLFTYEDTGSYSNNLSCSNFFLFYGDLNSTDEVIASV